MSNTQPSSGQSNGGGRLCYKRSHDNITDDSNSSSSSRQQRALVEDERQDFINYQKEMDERRDRYERIVKQSRDVIIECKRIIFQLHRIITADTSVDKEAVLKEAYKRFSNVRDKMLRQMAKELYSLDQYYYIKSYDWALEEYIEAMAFYKFLKSGEVLLYTEVVDALQFVDADNEEKKRLYIELPETTYLMGLFDVGGELMRLAVSEISSGNCNTTISVVNYMRLLHGCYEFLGNITHSSDWKKKSQVFRDSLMKVENALYKWKIREKDMPAVPLNVETN